MFHLITKSYFHSSDGFIVGYDITSRLSFTNVSTWLKEINDNAPEEIQKILIGNKCDLNEREVTTEEGKKLAEENGMKFFETSAKNDINVKETFEAITKDILDAQYKEEGDNIIETIFFIFCPWVLTRKKIHLREIFSRKNASP